MPDREQMAYDDVKAILIEIRDIQKEHCSAYKEFTQLALRTQQTAVRVQRISLMTGGLLVLALLAMMVWWMSRALPHLHFLDGSPKSFPQFEIDDSDRTA